ncbi:hypothetical protein L1887_62811 [Cichorium endivia]|nr:hypothetical protein L1887_62811 [Cichorium endivia]
MRLVKSCEGLGPIGRLEGIPSLCVYQIAKAWSEATIGDFVVTTFRLSSVASFNRSTLSTTTSILDRAMKPAATLAKIMPTVSDDGPPRPPHIRSDSRQQSPKNPKNLKPILLRRLLASIPSLSRKAPASESIQRQPPTKRNRRLVAIHTCPSPPIPFARSTFRCRLSIARLKKSSPTAHEENRTLASL